MKRDEYAISRKEIRAILKLWALRHLENLETNGRTREILANIKKIRH